MKSDNQSKPIFIFSAGWRSGSTLLQRLLLSSGDVIIWGEPYHHGGIVENLSESVKCITEEYPRQNWISDAWKNPLELTEKFVANFYPSVSYFLQSHINFYENLFAKPAVSKGISRWGFKEVRLTIDHAIYLSWLFPESKFIFMYRNPYHAYRSFKGARWYKRWPDELVHSAEQFGKHWKFLLEGYLNSYKQVNGLLISYEELVSEDFDIDVLNHFLEIHIDQNIISTKISGKKESQYRNVLSEEIEKLREVVEPVASQLGYFSL